MENRNNFNKRTYGDNRPIKPSKNGKYNMNFIDWNNEWERVSEVECKILNGEEIEDKEEENRVRFYMNNVEEKNGVTLNNMILVKSVDTSKECYICLKNFTRNKRIRQLPCKHMFCEDCIRPWLKTNHLCPTCKFNLKGEEENNELYN